MAEEGVEGQEGGALSTKSGEEGESTEEAARAGGGEAEDEASGMGMNDGAGAKEDAESLDPAGPGELEEQAMERDPGMAALHEGEALVAPGEGGGGGRGAALQYHSVCPKHQQCRHRRGSRQ